MYLTSLSKSLFRYSAERHEEQSIAAGIGGTLIGNSYSVILRHPMDKDITISSRRVVQVGQVGI